MHGVLPYGHMPNRNGKPCGGRYFNGDPIGYIQTDGRCESPIESGDTYGPVVYVAYVPAGGGDGLERQVGPPAGRARGRLGVRHPGGGRALRGRLAAGVARAWASPLAFAWAANPFTALLAEHELERRPRGSAAGVDVRPARDPRRPRGDARRGRPHQVRTPRDRAPVRLAARTGSRRSSASSSPRCCCSRCSPSTPTASRSSGTARSTTSSAGSRRCRSGRSASTTPAGGICGCRSMPSRSQSSSASSRWRCSPAAAPGTPPRWRRTPPPS